MKEKQERCEGKTRKRCRRKEERDEVERLKERKTD
jgi:hypothetical protein